MLDIYTTCPSVEDQSPESYRQQLVEFAQRTENAGLTGILTHSDNPGLDSWATAQMIIECTNTIVPLVAVNPIYMHPLTAVRMINSLGYLYGRRVALNLITGGYARHMDQVKNPLDHDQRYLRLTEYSQVMQLLLGTDRAVDYSGSYYELEAAHLMPRISSDLAPKFFVAGGSEACLRTQTAIGATRFFYPKEVSAYRGTSSLENTAIGFGVIARETTEEAWAVAHARFPRDELGEELHEFAVETVESEWHRNLAHSTPSESVGDNPYWLYPFKSYQKFTSYLVGSYAQVAEVLDEYHSLGASALLLETPPDQEDMDHVSQVFKLMKDRS